MPRVAFITDLHICRESRWAETLRIMDWCVSKFAELRPDVIALGGDTFDRKPDVGEMHVVAEWLVSLASIAPVVGVKGNHCPDGISVFNLLEAAHPIRIVEHPELHTAAGIEFALLPWPRKANLLAALPDAGKEQAQQVGNELLVNVLRGLGLSSTTGPRCFVGHVQPRGAKVSTGQPLAPGADFELGTEDLALANCDAYLLGHIHLPADLEANGKPCLMGGSFRRTAYGEVEEKSVVVVDFDDQNGTRVARETIPCADMFLVEANWVDDLDGARLAFHPYPIPVTDGCDIRIRYLVTPDQRSAARAAAEIERARLLALGARDVKLDPQVIPTSTARAPEVALAVTTAAKLQAMWRLRGTTPEPAREARLIEKLSELEAAS